MLILIYALYLTHTETGSLIKEKEYQMQEAIDLTGVKSQQYTKKPQQDVGAFLIHVITLWIAK